MNCEEIRELLDSLVDEELTAEDQNTVGIHLAQCAGCHLQHVQLLELRQTLGNVPRYQLPANFECALSLQLAKISSIKPVKHKTNRWKLVSTHVAAAMVGALVLKGIYLYPDAHELRSVDFVELHVRSLMDGSLTQVLAENTHEVKPWFAGKIDYSPPVKDLSRQGYILVGARVDHLLDRDVAVLVYKLRKHWINVVITPASFNIPPGSAAHQARRGYQIASASSNDFVFSAISDISADELSKFVQHMATFD